MKKGFTLIELLAVIVVLAIVSVIAVPTLINVINKARINALKDSAYGVVEAGNLYIAQNNIGQDILFNIENNTVTSEQTDKLLKYKGNIKNGIVVLYTTGKTALCIDNGKEYAIKLESETEVSTGIGTCEAYEAENGEFTVSTPIEELRKEYERQLEEQQQRYETQINQLEDNLANSGATLIGEYTANTTIDVSSYGATSANQFVVEVVSVNGLSAGPAGGQTSGYRDYSSSSAGFTPASLTLNDNTLSVTAPILALNQAWYNGSGGNRIDSKPRATASYRVYYVGNIKTNN